MNRPTKVYFEDQIYISYVDDEFYSINDVKYIHIKFKGIKNCFRKGLLFIMGKVK